MIVSKKEWILEQKDCADMLGMSLKEYSEEIKKTKIKKKNENNKKYNYDNSFLKMFGATENDLKKRSVING